MNEVRLIYASKFASGVGPREVQDILDVSRENNERLGITGALCYAPGLFLQCLEGPREAVNDLYARIVADTRHTQITLLEFSTVEQRTFSQWTMSYVRAEDLTRDLLRRICGSDSFNPFAMTSQQALAFINVLAEGRQVLLRKSLKEE